LAAAKTTPEALFEEKASAVGGSKIAKTGQIEIGRPGPSFTKGPRNKSILTIDWAHIKGSKTLLDTFFGVAQLPNNRQLDIEVYQTAGDTALAEEIFKSVAESLKFTDNQLLEAGSKIVAAFLPLPVTSGSKPRKAFF
jgi:glutathionylspermidine synthase